MAGLLLTGCQPARPASLSNDQVVQELDRVLGALNTGDYPGFSQDFSEDMKTSFLETQSSDLHTATQNASGNYLSCEQPELTNSQGYAVYRLNCKFEKESLMVTITYQVDGVKIEGLFFD